MFLPNKFQGSDSYTFVCVLMRVYVLGTLLCNKHFLNAFYFFIFVTPP